MNSTVEVPNIAAVAALVGDPARAAMLDALLGGMALTASELAAHAGVTKQTTSAHLARMVDGGLLVVARQGRHRYFRLAGPAVARLLEDLASIASGDTGGPDGTKAGKVRTGPREPALRKARACYDHLAGDMGVALYDGLVANGWLDDADGTPMLTGSGERLLDRFGIDVTALRRLRRPLCRSCLDWSARRSHLAGSLGAALFDRIQDEGWARRKRGSRVVVFTPAGEAAFRKTFRLSI